MAKSYGFKIKTEENTFGEQIDFATTTDLVTDTNGDTLTDILNKIRSYGAIAREEEDSSSISAGSSWSNINFPVSLASSVDYGFSYSSGILTCKYTGELEVQGEVLLLNAFDAENAIEVHYRLLTDDDVETIWYEGSIEIPAGDMVTLAIPRQYISAEQGEYIVLQAYCADTAFMAHTGQLIVKYVA